MSTERPDDIVRLVSAENPAQAHIWEQALQADGIRCKVVGDYLDASFGDLPGLKPEVWVRRRNVQRAEDVLNEIAANTEKVAASVATDLGGEE
jgi:hypothetical protein